MSIDTVTEKAQLRTSFGLGSTDTVEFGAIVPPSGTTAEIDLITTATIGQVIIDTDRSLSVRFTGASTYEDIVGDIPTADIALNTAKVGITSAQADAIVDNAAAIVTEAVIRANADTIGLGLINANTAAIALNTAKVGITTAQAADIVVNNAKEVRTDANGAFSAGDLGGNARGANAINIQGERLLASPSQVASGVRGIAIGARTTASGVSGIALGTAAAASGNYGSAALGNYCTASGYFGSTASGYYSTASGYHSTSSGCYASASGYYASAFGYRSTASGNYGSAALGNYCTASGDYSTAVGKAVKTTVANTTEIGYWSWDSTARLGAVRIHSTGMVAQTIQERMAEYLDGGATKGSEADNTLMREAIAFRRDGNAIYIDLNIGGTVTTLSLGTAS